MPTDADVIEDEPGQCPKCGMRLTPVRLDTTWTCPIHGAVHQDAAGSCPIDGRPLIQVTMSLSWHCELASFFRVGTPLRRPPAPLVVLALGSQLRRRLISQLFRQGGRRRWDFAGTS
jgi:hypothetical protein